jgi:hypothetical protein
MNKIQKYCTIKSKLGEYSFIISIDENKKNYIQPFKSSEIVFETYISQIKTIPEQEIFNDKLVDFIMDSFKMGYISINTVRNFLSTGELDNIKMNGSNFYEDYLDALIDYSLNIKVEYKELQNKLQFLAIIYPKSYLEVYADYCTKLLNKAFKI